MISLIVPASRERSQQWVEVAVESARKYIPGISEVIIPFWGDAPSYRIPKARTILCRSFGRPYNGGALKNVGARAARGDYLLFLDADALVRSRVPVPLDSLMTADIQWLDRDGGNRKWKFGHTWGMVTIGSPRIPFYAEMGFLESFPDWGGEDVNLVWRLAKKIPHVALHKELIAHRWHVPKTVSRSPVRELNIKEGGAIDLRSLVDRSWWGINTYLICYTKSVPAPWKAKKGTTLVQVEHWDQITSLAPSMLVGSGVLGAPPKGWVRGVKLQVFNDWREAVSHLPPDLGRNIEELGS